MRYEKRVIYPRKPNAGTESNARGDFKTHMGPSLEWKGGKSLAFPPQYVRIMSPKVSEGGEVCSEDSSTSQPCQNWQMRLLSIGLPRSGKHSRVWVETTERRSDFQNRNEVPALTEGYPIIFPHRHGSQQGGRGGQVDFPLLDGVLRKKSAGFGVKSQLHYLLAL